MSFCTGIEASLGHLDAVSARLAETRVELQKEVDLLQAELRVSQDPERMLVIQEMISVCNFSISLCSSSVLKKELGLAWSNDPHKRKGYRI